MKTMASKISIDDFPTRYIIEDVQRWREVIELIRLETEFFSQLFSAKKNQIDVQISDSLAVAIAKNKVIQQDFLSFINRFEGVVECEDMQCETHFFNAYCDFRTKAEGYFSEYRVFKRNWFLRLDPAS